jgi:hypothetical protein
VPSWEQRQPFVDISESPKAATLHQKIQSEITEETNWFPSTTSTPDTRKKGLKYSGQTGNLWVDYEDDSFLFARLIQPISQHKKAQQTKKQNDGHGGFHGFSLGLKGFGAIMELYCTRNTARHQVTTCRRRPSNGVMIASVVHSSSTSSV